MSKDNLWNDVRESAALLLLADDKSFGQQQEFMERLCAAVLKYGQATGQKGFVELRALHLLQLYSYEESIRTLAEKLAEADERCRSLHARVEKAEQANGRLAHTAQSELEKVAKQLAEANRKVDFFFNGEAYKAIVKERDEAVRKTKEDRGYKAELVKERSAALQRAAALEKELASTKEDLAATRKSLVRSLLALGR